MIVPLFSPPNAVHTRRCIFWESATFPRTASSSVPESSGAREKSSSWLEVLKVSSSCCASVAVAR